MGQPRIVEQKFKKGNENHQMVVMEGCQPSDHQLALQKDDGNHSYQIVGTWTAMKEAQLMTPSFDGGHTFEMTLGANQWEQFFLIQDGNWHKKIYPAFERSWKDMPCIGPHKGPVRPQYWLISGLPSDDLPEDDAGEPGDKYLITFK